MKRELPTPPLSRTTSVDILNEHPLKRSISKRFSKATSSFLQRFINLPSSFSSSSSLVDIEEHFSFTSDEKITPDRTVAIKELLLRGPRDPPIWSKREYLVLGIQKKPVVKLLKKFSRLNTFNENSASSPSTTRLEEKNSSRMSLNELYELVERLNHQNLVHNFDLPTINTETEDSAIKQDKKSINRRSLPLNQMKIQAQQYIALNENRNSLKNSRKLIPSKRMSLPLSIQPSEFNFVETVSYEEQTMIPKPPTEAACERRLLPRKKVAHITPFVFDEEDDVTFIKPIPKKPIVKSIRSEHDSLSSCHSLESDEAVDYKAKVGMRKPAPPIPIRN